ncbi:T9SS type A sorting domain-containing protein, partial [Flavobacteriales bacterium]|nr:T9SS type A sorting domain-containing protein [Flavobacteriales bacterium]
SSTTYRIQARTKFKSPSSGISGILTSFGKSCYVKTPGGVTTQLTNCESNVLFPHELQSFSEIIEAELIPTAHSYIFHFFENSTLVAQCTTTTTSQPYTRQTSLDNSQVQLLDLNKVYEVKVKARIFAKYGGGITSYGQSCYIRSPSNGPTVNLTSCVNDINNPEEIYDGEILLADIDPSINSIYEYRYIFDIKESNGTLIKRCTTANNPSNRKKLCLKGCPSSTGITNAKISSSYIGSTLMINVTSWVKNGYDPSASPPIIIPNEGPCYIKYMGSLKSNSVEDTKAKIKIYPNPNDGKEFYLNVYGFENTKDLISISIIDLYGKTIHTETKNSDATQIITNIHLNHPLVAGVYIVKVSKGKVSHIKKMVVQ